MARRNRDLLIARASTPTRFLVAIFALVLVATPVSAFSASIPRQFGGTTSQSTTAGPEHITMDVGADKVSDLEFGALVLKGSSACSLNSAEGSSFIFSTGSLAVSNHRLAGRLKDDLGDTVIVHARTSPKAITGSFVVFTNGAASGTGPCTSGIVKFVAESASAPAGSTAYSGTVGPGWLITFDVSAHSTTVDDLVVAYDETCNGSPSDVTPTFRFKALTITSGEFSGTTTESFGPAVSDTVHIDGTFSGGVAAGQVSDTSRIATFPTCTQSSPFVATASS
jgi:hypothetical protein